MSKQWYPVIDYLKCNECGACIRMCRNGVYDVSKAPTPVVANVDGCITGCHGCGNKCLQGAITYVGDNTGWAPPHGEKNDNDTKPCCSCACDS